MPPGSRCSRITILADGQSGGDGICFCCSLATVDFRHETHYVLHEGCGGRRLAGGKLEMRTRGPRTWDRFAVPSARLLIAQVAVRVLGAVALAACASLIVLVEP